MLLHVAKGPWKYDCLKDFEMGSLPGFSEWTQFNCKRTLQVKEGRHEGPRRCIIEAKQET